MRRPHSRDRRILVLPSAVEPGCYRWVIRNLDGTCLARSPCAFASRAAARLSASCWDHDRAGGALRVLIVDDNVIYADALRSLLEREAHTVVGIADRAAAALDLARAEQPHLALVDLTLRDGCSGPDIGRRLAREGVGVLFLTATPHLAPTGIPGVLDTLPKPAGDARLLRAVAAARMRIQGGC
ncbi:response regulator [Methylobacterium sp. CM6257]